MLPTTDFARQVMSDKIVVSNRSRIRFSLIAQAIQILPGIAPARTWYQCPIQPGTVASCLTTSSSKPTISGWNSPASSRSAGSTCASPRGTIHALIGPNGAGKTTVFNLLTKFLQSDPRPHRLQRARHHRAGAGRRGAARAGAIVPDLGRVPSPDRARERAHRAAAQARRLVRLLALQARARRPQRARAVADRRRRACVRSPHATAVELPYGRKRALEIATTLALDPEMLLLDEPTAGMGHEDIDRISALIKRVAADRTVLMVEHNLSVVADLSDRITVLTRGRVLAEGDYDDGLRQSGRARSLSRGRPCLAPRRCSRSKACRPGTASRMCCTASPSRSAPARWSRCSAATAPARRRR